MQISKACVKYFVRAKYAGMQPMSIQEALDSGGQTRRLELGPGVLDGLGSVFRDLFGDARALVIADRNTFQAAGGRVVNIFRREGIPCHEPFIFTEPDLEADQRQVDVLQRVLAQAPGSRPVAVGSGTINDLVKFAAGQAGLPYMVVPTAASMDGYAAFGASITREGSKETMPCAAPLGIVADLAVIREAPAALNAAGYADLLAKTTGGADWLLADALRVEPLHERAWTIAQGGLEEGMADPAGIRQGNPDALLRLMRGLLLSGVAMQTARSSRPASGAEHQFSHLWDMRHHRHHGRRVFHGFQVGIGTVAVSALYERLLGVSLEELEPENCLATWPDWNTLEEQVRARFEGKLVEVALRESAAKLIEPAALRRQLFILKEVWPRLREKLRRQVPPSAEVKRRLKEAGAPSEPEEIGISREGLRQSYFEAWCIRRRFTVLDLAMRTGGLQRCLARSSPP